MQQIAVVLLSVFLGLKDFFGTKDGKKVRNVLLGVAAFFIADVYIRKQKTKSALENAANDPITSFAIRLHDALNPTGISWLNNIFGDGTDETTIQQIATEMQAYKNFDKVALKFRTLYGLELATELEKDGVYNLFIKYYTVTTNGGTGGTGIIYVKVNNTITVKAGYNLRDGLLETVSKTTKGTESYIVKEIWQNKVIAGKKGVWLYVTDIEFYLPTRYWLHVDAIKTIQK